MSIQSLTIAEPFFGLRLITHEPSVSMSDKAIVLNLSETPIRIRQQTLGHLQSVVLKNTLLEDVAHAVVVERFADYSDEAALLADIREIWPSALM